MGPTIICTIAFLVSLLTFFSGFGLGTLLLPAFALFFPIDLAVGMTAIVHFLSNLLKLGLVVKFAHWKTVFSFGLPAMLSAAAGAWVFVQFSDLAPLVTYQLSGHSFSVLPIKLVIAVLIIAFVLVDLIPEFANAKIDERFIPLGGLLSGFFGGLSGHQGALRSAFLARSGLSKEAFIGTGVVIACMIDTVRISIYSVHLTADGMAKNFGLLTAVILSAFLGTCLGKIFLKKTTMHSIQMIVSVSLLCLAFALGIGVV